MRDSMAKRIPIDTTKVADKLKGAGIKYYITLALPEGNYAIRTLVRVAENGAKGFARTDLAVPRSGDVALSPPIFIDAEAGKWLMLKGDSHDKTNAAYPFEVNGDVFVPAAPRVKAGEPRKFVVFVRNAAPDELTIDTNPKTTVVSQLKSAGGAKLVFELAGAPSASTLNVTVKKKGSTTEQTSSVPLIVQ